MQWRNMKWRRKTMLVRRGIWPAHMEPLTKSTSLLPREKVCFVFFFSATFESFSTNLALCFGSCASSSPCRRCPCATSSSSACNC